MRAVLGALAAALALALALVGCDGGGDDEAATTEAPPSETERSAPSGTSGGVFAEIPAIVREVEPSIVSIAVQGASGAGEGSGVIWSEDGLVVTNEHVVRGAADVAVVLASGARLPGEVRATDPLTDLAVVAVERDGLPAAEFATELPVQGELVLAMGNPLGFENTVTEGIVSGLHRAIPSGGQTPALVDLVQTSAPISPGNSGGALVDVERRVVGINVAYIPPGAGAVALGFAIPSPTVLDVVRQLVETGEVRHAFLGIRPGQLTPEIGDELGIRAEQGVLVLSIVEGSAAERAGLEPGDVIVRLEGQELETVEDLLAELRDHEPGDEIAIELLRDGEPVETTVTLTPRPEG